MNRHIYVEENGNEDEAPYMETNCSVEQYNKRLGSLTGVKVSVVITSRNFVRNDYTQVSVAGYLEGQPKTGRYSVVTTDDNYAHFFAENVQGILCKELKVVIYINPEYQGEPEYQGDLA